MNQDNLLEVKDLCFHYTNIDVIHDINFSVKKGDFIGLYGDNGAGKSTFIKLLLAQLKPCQGSIVWFGDDIKQFNSWEKIGYVPQKTIMSNTHFPATVKEVVMANLYKDIGMFKFPRKKHLNKVLMALDMVKMKDFLYRQIGKMSGGQMQRIYIARALVNSPEVLILDEPTSGVDAHSVKNLFATLKHLNKKHNITIIMITHDIKASLDYVQSFYKIKSGRLEKVEKNEYNN